jgi:hypothetical protein
MAPLAFLKNNIQFLNQFQFTAYYTDIVKLFILLEIPLKEEYICFTEISYFCLLVARNVLWKKK